MTIKQYYKNTLSADNLSITFKYKKRGKHTTIFYGIHVQSTCLNTLMYSNFNQVQTHTCCDDSVVSYVCYLRQEHTQFRTTQDNMAIK